MRRWFVSIAIFLVVITAGFAALASSPIGAAVISQPLAGGSLDTPVVADVATATEQPQDSEVALVNTATQNSTATPVVTTAAPTSTLPTCVVDQGAEPTTAIGGMLVAVQEHISNPSNSSLEGYFAEASLELECEDLVLTFEGDANMRFNADTGAIYYPYADGLWVTPIFCNWPDDCISTLAVMDLTVFLGGDWEVVLRESGTTLEPFSLFGEDPRLTSQIYFDWNGSTPFEAVEIMNCSWLEYFDTNVNDLGLVYVIPLAGDSIFEEFNDMIWALFIGRDATESCSGN